MNLNIDAVKDAARSLNTTGVIQFQVYFYQRSPLDDFGPIIISQMIDQSEIKPFLLVTASLTENSD